MPDMSTYIKNKRIVAQSNANTSADSRKFRAPTRDVAAYDPYFPGKKDGSCLAKDGVCNTTVKHNLFAAVSLSANPSPTTG